MKKSKIMKKMLYALVFASSSTLFAQQQSRLNVLFVIADDLTLNALSCYGNNVCQTPNIDKLASEGVKFTSSYCQTPYCGPSRASMFFGYYPDATNMYGYNSGRKSVGKHRDSLMQ